MSSKLLTSLYHLGHFFMVETLSLADNRIARLSKLECLKALRKLVLDNNEILGVYDTELSNLAELREVFLRNNRIKSLRGLQVRGCLLMGDKLC